MNEDAIKRRIKGNKDQIKHTLEVASSGNPYAAEPDRTRRVSRLQTKAALSHSVAAVIDNQIERLEAAPMGEILAAADGDGAGEAPPPLPVDGGAERIWGNTVDFVNVSFLEKGARIARSVGRVAFRNERPLGSGFLIGEGLFLTNHHVIGSAEEAAGLMLQFEYEKDLTGSQKSPTNFAIDTSIFLTSDDSQDGLDYSLFLVGERLKGDRPLEFFGWSGLSDSRDKHMLGEFANVVQHPRGRYKEVVLRENRLVARGENALHYIADTEPGSSGSPVFNSEWRPIALHHWGAPWADVFGEDGQQIDRNVNEGIRISSIVRDIRTQLSQMELDADKRARIERALFFGAEPEAAGDRFEPDYCKCSGSAEDVSGPRMSADGRLQWTVPVEISVGIPSLDAGTRGKSALHESHDYSFPSEPAEEEAAPRRKPSAKAKSKSRSKK